VGVRALRDLAEGAPEDGAADVSSRVATRLVVVSAMRLVVNSRF